MGERCNVAPGSSQHDSHDRAAQNGQAAIDCIKLLLLGDRSDSTCGGRCHLDKLNSAGNPKTIRLEVLLNALANGEAFKGCAEQCMADYDLDGWTAPDLISPLDRNRGSNRLELAVIFDLV